MSDVAGEMDQLRITIGEVEALVAMLMLFFDNSDWSGVSSLLIDRMGYALNVLGASASAAVSKFERFQIAFVDAQPAPGGERWDYSEGTARSEGAGNTEIIRRIRERSPDGRFEGSSDEELIELFKRNKRVLSRSDEDVIAAMTRPR